MLQTITQETVNKVHRIYCGEHFEKHYKNETTKRIPEIRNFLHDLYVVRVPFEEAYNDNIISFTIRQAYELCSIYEQLQ